MPANKKREKWKLVNQIGNQREGGEGERGKRAQRGSHKLWSAEKKKLLSLFAQAAWPVATRREWKKKKTSLLLLDSFFLSGNLWPPFNHWKTRAPIVDGRRQSGMRGKPSIGLVLFSSFLALLQTKSTKSDLTKLTFFKNSVNLRSDWRLTAHAWLTPAVYNRRSSEKPNSHLISLIANS